MKSGLPVASVAAALWTVTTSVAVGAITLTTETPTITTTPTTTATPTQTPTPTPICTSGVRIANTKLKILNDLDPRGDEKLYLSGYVQLPTGSASIDPIANGFQFYITDPSGHRILLDRELPGGSNYWALIGNRWQYTDALGSVGGMFRVRVVRFPKKPGYYRIKLRREIGDFQVASSEIPFKLVIVLGGTAQANDGHCGTTDFSPSNGTPPTCHHTGATLACSGA